MARLRRPEVGLMMESMAVEMRDVSPSHATNGWSYREKETSSLTFD